MPRISGASLIASLLVVFVLIIGVFALLPQAVRHGAFAVFQRPIEPVHVQAAVAEVALVPTDTATPTLTPEPSPTPVPTLIPTPTVLPTDSPAVGDIGATLDKYLNNLVDAKYFHGAVLVARGDQILLSKGYGQADFERGIANTANTRFRIASMTKQFTALSIMQLVAAGKLGLDDSMCKYIDNCPERWSEITIRQLLNHTHGLPNYTDFPSYEQIQMNPMTPAQLIDRLRGQWPVWTPGVSYHYGNTGYVLLGAILEKVAGQPYGDYVHEHIFAPLGMDNSGVTYAPAPGDNWALPYQTFSRPAAPLDTSTLFSAGSLYSTVEDLYRWDQALYTEKLLPATFRDQMFTPGLNRYGFGWKIINDNGHLRYSHPGEMDGCRTVILRYPNERVTVIVLANMHDANADGIAAYLARIVFGS